MTRRGARSERVQEALDALEGWWQLVAVALGAGLLVAGFTLRWLGELEARMILAGFPLVMLGLGLLALQEVRGLARGLGLVVMLGAALASGSWIVQVIWPPAPYGSAMLGRPVPGAAPGATIDVPAEVAELVVTVHGELDARASATSMRYVLWLERDGARRLVQGTLSREEQQSQGGGGYGLGRGMPSTTVTVHETDAHRVTLPGAGAVRLHLGSLEVEGGSRRQPQVQVRVARPPLGMRASERGLLIAIGGAALAQVLAARQGRRLHATALVAATAVFTIAVGRWFNPDSALVFAMGALLLGGFAGGLGGWILGGLLAHLARPRPAPAPEPGPSPGPGA